MSLSLDELKLELPYDFARAHLSFWISSIGQQRWKKNAGIEKKLEWNMSSRDLVNLYPIQNCYPGQTVRLLPRATLNQDNSYPRQFVLKSKFYTPQLERVVVGQNITSENSFTCNFDNYLMKFTSDSSTKGWGNVYPASLSFTPWRQNIII